MEQKRGKAEEFFTRAGKKIDDLFSEISKSNISEKLELKERLNELKRNKESLEKDFNHFTEDNKEVFKTQMTSGDCIAIFNGGHSLKCLTDDTILYEIKTGPYLGAEKDKVYLEDLND